MTPDDIRKAIYEASEMVDPPEYNKDVDAYMRMASLKANAYGKLVAFLAQRELERMELGREPICTCFDPKNRPARECEVHGALARSSLVASMSRGNP